MRRIARALGFVLGFATAAALVLFALHHALEAAETPATSVGLEVMAVLDRQLEIVRATRGRWRVVYLGDSTVIAYPDTHHLPSRLQQTVSLVGQRRPPIVIISMAAMGLTPFDFYFLSDAIIDARPDQIIIPFNLAAFSDPWRNRFPRPELASWIHVRNIPEALVQPLQYIGLTADRLLIEQIWWRAFGFTPWHFVRERQARLDKARLDLELRASQRHRSNAVTAFRRRNWVESGRRMQIAKQQRYNEFGTRVHLGDAFEGQDESHPVIRIFGETLARFREAGIPVLVYTVPMNYEHSRSVGVFDREGLDETLRSIERTAERYDARYLDLHDLFPDSAFADAPGHFLYEGGVDGPLEVARRLAPYIVSEARGQGR